MLNNVTPQSSKPQYSMAGITYSALPLGSIRIGHSQEMPGGSVQLIKDDEFKITQPLRSTDGSWLRDELDSRLRTNLGGEEGVSQRKLREIPIRIAVNDPSLIARAQLQAFDRDTGKVMCSSKGNGTAKRWSAGSGTADVTCVGADRCSFANSGNVDCKFFGRVNVQVEGQSDELGTYVLRSTSYNTMRTIESKLWQFWALFGKKLRGVPLKLQLRPVQTQASNWETFYVVDLVLNGCTLAEAKKHADERTRLDEEENLSISSFEEALSSGLNNGGFYGGDAEDGFDPSEFIEASQFASSMQGKQRSSVEVASSAFQGSTSLESGNTDVDEQVSPPTSSCLVNPSLRQGVSTGVFIASFNPKPEQAVGNKPIVGLGRKRQVGGKASADF